MFLVNYPEVKDEAKLPVFVRGIGVEYAQNSVARPSLVYPQILYSVKGIGLITIDGKTFEIPEKTGFFLNKGIEYHYRPKGQEWIVNWVAFDFGVPGIENMLFLNSRFVLTAYKTPEKLDILFRDIYNALTLDPAYGNMRASGELYRFLLEYNRQIAEIPEVTEKSNRVINRIVDFINEHYSEEISLEMLCEAAGGLSEQYLCRLFKQNIGMRPIEYILKKRIGIARSYLEKTDMPINDIAQMTGFNNTSYFYRNFKKFTGTSPLSYRQSALGIKHEDGEDGVKIEKDWL